MNESDYDLKLKISLAYQVCQECGIAYGAGISAEKKQRTLSTWHDDKCDICGKRKPVTEFRDFGFANPKFVIEDADL